VFIHTYRYITAGLYIWISLIPLISQQIGRSELTRRAEIIVSIYCLCFDCSRRQTPFCGTAITPPMHKISCELGSRKLYSADLHEP